MTVLTNKRISITGGEGFLGSYVIKSLKKKNCKNISIVSHKEFDLVNANDVKRMYLTQKPDIVFHLAAAVGGIEINQKNPGKFFFREGESFTNSKLFLNTSIQFSKNLMQKLFFLTKKLPAQN